MRRTVVGGITNGDLTPIHEGVAMDRLAATEAFMRVIGAGSFSGAAQQLRAGQMPSCRALS